MGRPRKTFEQKREDATQETLAFLRSRLPEWAVLSDVRAYWRMLGSPGMADNALLWLEQDGLVKWDKATNVIMLTKEGEK